MIPLILNRYSESDLSKMQKGVFSLNDQRIEIPTNTTMYDCAHCEKEGTIVKRPGPPGRGNEVSSPGCATTVNICTGCGRYDGPWVPAPW